MKVTTLPYGCIFRDILCNIACEKGRRKPGSAESRLLETLRLLIFHYGILDFESDISRGWRTHPPAFVKLPSGGTRPV